MLNSFGFRLPVLALGTCLLITGGCASSKPSKFYTLSALATSETGTNADGSRPGIAIGVGPITLPEHLDRSQIVTRTSSNHLELAEFNRWAGVSPGRLLQGSRGKPVDPPLDGSCLPLSMVKVSAHRLPGGSGCDPF